MNRIDELFTRKSQSVLSVYFTAGYPHLDDTAMVLEGLEKAGADLVEIGFPFSDPVADGPVIQASSHRALENGMNLDILFGQLKSVKERSRIPKIMMGYYNTVYQYDVQRFIDQCVACGIDGAIIPDLPPEVYEKEYRPIFESAGVHFICLVAPETPPAREEYLRSLSRGFIYLLSSSSTTGNSLTPRPEGTREDLTPQPDGTREDLTPRPDGTREDLTPRPDGTREDLTPRPDATREDLTPRPPLPRSLRSRERGGPSMVGFGIHDHKTFEMACEQANGAIIGTAFIRKLSECMGNDPSAKDHEKLMHDLCGEFVREIRG